MKIEYMTLGPFATNTYIVYDEKTSHGVVIDPSFSPDKYISELNDKKIILESILLTHAHVDHLAGLNQLREAFPDAKFYMDKRDEELLRDPNMNLSDFLPEPIVCKPADVWVKDRDIIKTCGLEFTVLDTAGHTPGGISFYLKNEGIVLPGTRCSRGPLDELISPAGI